MNTIAVDCGASFLKIGLIEGGHIIDKLEYRPDSLHELSIYDKDSVLPEKLRYEIGAVKDAILKFTDYGEHIKLAICNEMHGFVIADDKGVPCRDYVSWQEEWTSEYVSERQITWHEHLMNLISERDIYKTGMPYKQGLPSANLPYYVKLNNMEDCGLRFYTLGDFIISWLSGNVDVSTDLTNAAATGLVDIERGCWNDNLIENLGLRNVKFPVISKEYTVCSWCWKHRQIDSFPAIGDQQASLLGSGMSNIGQLSVNMGTGAQISVLKNRIWGGSYSPQEKVQVRPFFDDKFLETVPHIPSGRAINVYIRFIKEIIEDWEMKVSDDDIWRYIDKKLRDTDKEELKVDLSFFTNAVSDRTTGCIDNISESNMCIGGLFKAVFDRMADNVVTCVNMICDIKDIKEILFSGGIIRKNALILEGILDRIGEVEYKIAENESLIGLDKYVKKCETLSW